LNINYSQFSLLDLALRLGSAFFSFATTKRKETKETCLPAGRSHRCMKIAKNLHSLNCGNSSLRSSDSSQFLMLIPRFSIRNFHEVVNFYFYLKVDKKNITVTA